MYRISSKFVRMHYFHKSPWRDEGYVLVQRKWDNLFIGFSYYDNTCPARLTGVYILFYKPLNFDHSELLDSEYLLSMLGNKFFEVV